jgi:hypothetical protein
MDIKVASFRWGLEHLGQDNEEWVKVQEALKNFTRADIEESKLVDLLEWREGFKKSPRVGGQPLINTLIDEKFKALGWEAQIHVLPVEFRDAYWTMDFRKNDIGIEVSFNNAGALAQNLLRLSVMSESNFRAKEDQIRLGILITATEKLKKWSNMDSSVITYESVNRIMPLINLNIPTPIVLVGIDAANDGIDWEESKLFGHKTLSPFKSLSEAEQIKWHSLIDG